MVCFNDLLKKPLENEFAKPNFVRRLVYVCVYVHKCTYVLVVDNWEHLYVHIHTYRVRGPEYVVQEQGGCNLGQTFRTQKCGVCAATTITPLCLCAIFVSQPALTTSCNCLATTNFLLAVKTAEAYQEPQPAVKKIYPFSNQKLHHNFVFFLK